MSSSEGEIYEVDYILKSRKRGRNVEYLVRWKGFGDEEDSWEPLRNLKSAKDAIDAFNKKEITTTTTGRRKSGGRAAATESETTTRTTSGASSSTRTTTRTTVVTQSEASSPESSPVVTRRTVRTETVERSEGKASKKRSDHSLARLFQITRKDIPIVILVVCLLVIASTFIYEKL